jgi:hypothetical protein
MRISRLLGAATTLLAMFSTRGAGSTSSPSGTGNLGLLGTQTVTLGATLHVGPGQAAAAYSGTYPVTLAYN